MFVRVTKTPDSIRFNVRVVPKSSRNNLSVLDEDSFKLKITAPPVDGKANQACEKYISSLLGVAKSYVNIISGLKSKSKTVEVKGNPDELCQKLFSSAGLK